MYPESWVGTDFYRTLGVGKTATPAEIKKEYRWLAKKFHPDFNAGDERAAAKFREIQLAYETLIDEDSRQHYDEYLGLSGSAGSATYSEDFVSSEDTPSQPQESQGQSSPASAWTKAALVVSVIVGLILAVVAGTFVSTGSDQPAQNSSASPVPERSTAPVIPESRYSADDIRGCEDFLDWAVDLGGAVAPTNVSEQRELFSRVELDIKGFFYLADDLELKNISNSAASAAAWLTLTAGTDDDALWTMVTTGFQDKMNELNAVCRTVN